MKWKNFLFKIFLNISSCIRILKHLLLTIFLNSYFPKHLNSTSKSTTIMPRLHLVTWHPNSLCIAFNKTTLPDLHFPPCRLLFNACPLVTFIMLHRGYKLSWPQRLSYTMLPTLQCMACPLVACFMS